MKHWLPPLLVLALLALLGTAEARSLAQSCGEWCAALEESAACTRAEDWDGARGALVRVTEDWETQQTLLRVLLGHDALDDITLRLTALTERAEAEDGEEYRALVSELTAALRLLWEAEALRVGNIL